jgi:uncharacterized protein (DUF1499 family)
MAACAKRMKLAGLSISKEFKLNNFVSRPQMQLEVARLGYSDLGVNRCRIENLRALLARQESSI